MPIEDEPASDGITQRLVQAAQWSDTEAFDALYERIAPQLLCWIDLRLPRHVARRTSSQDLMQETWTRAWPQFRLFQGERISFRRWMFGIAKNVLLESYRAFQRSERVRLEEGASQPIDVRVAVSARSTQLLHRLMREDTAQKVRDFAGNLDPEDRELMVLCGLEGLTRAEAAAKLRMNVEAVTKRWQRLTKQWRSSPLARLLVED